MIQLHPYLVFNGNCREAMEFYKNCIGGELKVLTFGEAPPNEAPSIPKDQIMHSSLKNDQFFLMASDGLPDTPISQGENVSLSISVSSVEEADRIFQALSEKGKVTMPLEKTFWAERFGTLKDQFGVNWMISCEKPK